MKNLIRRFIKEEDGVGVIEIVLILAALVVLALLFKDNLLNFFKDLWTKVTGNELINDLDKTRLD